jgi:hypothetical protein
VSGKCHRVAYNASVAGGLVCPQCFYPVCSRSMVRWRSSRLFAAEKTNLQTADAVASGAVGLLSQHTLRGEIWQVQMAVSTMPRANGSF